MTTVHANSARDAVSRLETMVSMAGMDLPLGVVRQQIAAAIDVVVQLARFSDGSRRLVSLSEITGTEGDVLCMAEIFRFEQEGVGPENRVLGEIRPTGVTPRFVEKLRTTGVRIPPGLFMREERAGRRV
jgi:pilus assembly protein CpaF